MAKISIVMAKVMAYQANQLAYRIWQAEMQSESAKKENISERASAGSVSCHGINAVISYQYGIVAALGGWRNGNISAAAES